MTENNCKLYVKKIQKEMSLNSNYICVKFLIEIGKYLYIHPTKMPILYKTLYDIYGNTIIFSKRNLRYCKVVFHKYKSVLDKIPKNMSWNNLIILLRKGYDVSEDLSIFHTIQKYNLNEAETKFFIRNNYIRKYGNTNIVSNITLELINLKEICE